MEKLTESKGSFVIPKYLIIKWQKYPSYKLFQILLTGLCYLYILNSRLQILSVFSLSQHQLNLRSPEFSTTTRRRNSMMKLSLRLFTCFQACFTSISPFFNFHLFFNNSFTVTCNEIHHLLHTWHTCW